MSRENVEIIRGSYEAVNRAISQGDIDAWLEGFHPDVEVHDLPTIFDAPIYRGHDNLRRWVAMMREVWAEGSYYDPPGRFSARARSSGATVVRETLPPCTPAEAARSSASRITANLRDALEAVGLREQAT